MRKPLPSARAGSPPPVRPRPDWRPPECFASRPRPNRPRPNPGRPRGTGIVSRPSRVASRRRRPPLRRPVHADSGLMRIQQSNLMREIKVQSNPMREIKVQCTAGSYWNNEKEETQKCDSVDISIAVATEKSGILAVGRGNKVVEPVVDSDVVLIPKWNKVLYLDSGRSKARDHRVLKGVLDEAYDTWTVNRGRATGKLAHATKFPCHQQPPGNLCGFYTAHHMMVTMGLINLEAEEEFEVLTCPINNGVLCDIREKMASFIVSKVINKKGEFHCNRTVSQ